MLNRTKRVNDIHYGKYNWIGGKIETGESPEIALEREVFEETGLILNSYKLRGIITFPNFANNNDYLMFLYESDDFYGELVEGEEGYLEFIENSKISSLPLWEGDHLFLEWLKNKGFFSGRIVYHNKVLVHHEVKFY
jgi:8-oxo-dGTP diphosphatase